MKIFDSLRYTNAENNYQRYNNNSEYPNRNLINWNVAYSKKCRYHHKDSKNRFNITEYYNIDRIVTEVELNSNFCDPVATEFKDILYHNPSLSIVH